MLLKAQAAKELSDGGVFRATSHEMVSRIRQTLEDLLVLSERSGTWQADRASGITGRVLDQLDRDQAALRKPEYPFAHWNHPDLDDRLRLAWLECDLVGTMAHCVGWEVTTWERHGGTALEAERLDYLYREADMILGADDVFEAADAWLDQHWDPERLRNAEMPTTPS